MKQPLKFQKCENANRPLLSKTNVPRQVPRGKSVNYVRCFEGMALHSSTVVCCLFISYICVIVCVFLCFSYKCIIMIMLYGLFKKFVSYPGFHNTLLANSLNIYICIVRALFVSQDFWRWNLPRDDTFMKRCLNLISPFVASDNRFPI